MRLRNAPPNAGKQCVISSLSVSHSSTRFTLTGGRGINFDLTRTGAENFRESVSIRRLPAPTPPPAAQDRPPRPVHAIQPLLGSGPAGRPVSDTTAPAASTPPAAPASAAPAIPGNARRPRSPRIHACAPYAPE